MKTKFLRLHFFIIFAAVLVGGQSFAAIFTVTNTSGDAAVPGSLPYVLFQTYWNSPGQDTIRFAIPGAGPHVITLTTPLALGDSSSLLAGVDVNGTTQAGYAGSPLIYINANGQDVAFNVPPDSKNSALQGLCIYNFKIVGIAILSGANNNWIQNNWVGFVPSGAGYATTTSNGAAYAYCIGIGISGPSNVISGNTISGVYNGITMGSDPVLAPSSSYYLSYGNWLGYNKVGTDPTGHSKIGNTSDGIFLGDGSTNNFIAGNNVSCHASSGIEILGRTGWANYIYGNFAGVGVSGENLGNGELGILVSNASEYNYIGNYGVNYVYYNGLGGIVLGLNDAAAGTVGAAYVNYVYYNSIYGNNKPDYSQGVGVSITGGSQYNTVQANVIGGQIQHGVIVSKAYYNSISYNSLGISGGDYGFGVFLQSTYYNWIVGNSYGYNYLGTVGKQVSTGDVVQ